MAILGFNFLYVITMISLLNCTSFKQSCTGRLVSCNDATSSGGVTLPPDLGWVSEMAPVFRVNGDNIRILRTPHDYHVLLKGEIMRAKKRIVIATFHTRYEKFKDNLMEEFATSLRSHPDLQVRILLDYGFATMPEDGYPDSPTSRFALLPLLEEFGNRFCVSLYHSPHLRGLLKSTFPNFSMLFGVQHVKVYVFDDNVIISSANIDFLETEQNRYMFLQEPGLLAEFCNEFVISVAEASIQLLPDNSEKMEDDMESHPFKDADNGEAYKREFRSRVAPVLDPNNWNHSNQCNQDDCDTWIVPLFQMAPYQINVDMEVVQRFLREVPANASVALLSPYMGLTEEMQEILLQESKATFHLLTVSPQTNPLSLHPVGGKIQTNVYKYLINEFYSRMDASNQHNRVFLSEYVRDGWTFHAKGIWLYPYEHSLPTRFFIGSTNYNERWKYKDLDAEFLVATNNIGLRTQLHEELNYYFETSEQLDKETLDARLIPPWIPYYLGFSHTGYK